MLTLRQNEVILFQGDSITDGNRGRNQDLNHIMGHGYQYIVGAKLHVDNLERNIKTFNRGISGNRVSDLYGRWVEDTLNLNPTILSILIGVNDAWFSYENQSGSDAKRYEKIYRMLLDETLAHNQSCKFVIMEPFVGEYFEDEKRKAFFRDYVSTLASAAKAVASDYGAVFVPLQEMFDEYSKRVPAESLIWDGVHPTIIGHELIARKWLECAEKGLF
ncbi:MAG: SGNH/GDSL hydrolase family protein [Clostridiales bacterium]|nr:SGNH/GDSL hydrolase family protein [Clostridiales bacterium]